MDLARALVGAALLVDDVGRRIVSTEAYDLDEPASHGFAGQTAGNAAMFGPPDRPAVHCIYACTGASTPLAGLGQELRYCSAL